MTSPFPVLEFPVLDDPPPRNAGQVRLLLVDDHHVVRAGLHALLALEDDFDVVGEACDAAEGIELALRLAPDVVMTDLSLGAKSGVQLISSLRELAPISKVLVLTVHADEEYIKAALSAGARGYVLKDSCRADLVQAIRTVHQEDYYLCSRVADAVVSRYLAKTSAETALLQYELTEREREIIALVAKGKPSKRIATQLGLSVKTIAKHRANFMHKLDLHNSAAITMFAMKHGLVSPNELQHTLQ